MAKSDQPIEDVPVFNGIYGALSTPTRQMYMMGAVWKLAEVLADTRPRILEIGSWGGLSSLTFAWALEYFAGGGYVHCIDAWHPYVDRSVNRSEIYSLIEDALASDQPYQVFLHNIRHAPGSVEITHTRGTSQSVLPTLTDATFSLVYIDGDHSYKAVLHDIQQSIRLVAEGGIICGDDLEVQAHECHPKVFELDPNLDLVQDSSIDVSFHPGVTRAVADMFGEVSSWDGFWAMQKRQNDWLPLSLEGIPFRPPPHIPEEMLIKINRMVSR